MKTKKIKISDLEVGMKIKSYDHVTNSIVFKEVTDVWETTVNHDQQVRLEFNNGTSIECSVNHPIMVLTDDKEVIQKLPMDLDEFDQIISESQTVYLYDRKLKRDNPTNYIDLTVDGTHTFFTSDTQYNEMVLTHNSQGGVRGGAATIFWPIWHLEAEELLVLKNNKGTEDTRARHMDYGVQFNRLMYERLMQGGNITLFSPSDVPGLYDAFFEDQKEFKRLYENAEKNTRIRKKVVSAIDLFSSFMQERKDTGRVYLQNVDHSNSHSPFDESVYPIRQSNLCTEVNLPCKPLNSIDDENGLISLCTLSAINWGNIKSPADFEIPCKLAVRGLDELLSYQEYPIKAAKKSTDLFRPLGVGIINLAYWMAKNDVKYSDDSALELLDEYTEAFTYYLIKASIDLAKEKGSCDGFKDLKYSKGILPIDTRKPEIDEIVPHKERMDWNKLREEVQKFGIRNATVSAIMPAETSAIISNSTNGIEPPRALVSIKQSKEGTMKQVVPEYRRLKNKYELLWEQKNPEGYLKVCGVLQKYIDQGISVNTSYNPSFYPEGNIPMSEMLGHLLLSYKLGLKQLYYFNTNDGAGEIDVDKLIKGQDLTIESSNISDSDDCESCKI